MGWFTGFGRRASAGPSIEEIAKRVVGVPIATASSFLTNTLGSSSVHMERFSTTAGGRQAFNFKALGIILRVKSDDQICFQIEFPRLVPKGRSPNEDHDPGEVFESDGWRESPLRTAKGIGPAASLKQVLAAYGKSVIESAPRDVQYHVDNLLLTFVRSFPHRADDIKNIIVSTTRV